MPAESPKRRVVIVGFDGVQALDIVGPLEVFNAAERLGRASGYTTELVGRTRNLRSASGLGLEADATIRTAPGEIDTLIVAGGLGVEAAERDTRLIEWIATAAATSRRVTSVCTGAFLLARAGLLDGRRVTTHWSGCERLRRRYPAIEVDPEPIFVRDGEVWTSAGVTAGMDLALALVEDDLGAEAALEIARWLVLYVKRPGGQSQFSASLALQRAEREPLRRVQAWVLENLDSPLTVEALAEQAEMSVRSFSRAFSREVGLSPAAYVEAVRVERARLALESTDAGIEQIAASCGFGTPETLRRAFARRLGVAPSSYRDRFTSTRPQAKEMSR